MPFFSLPSPQLLLLLLLPLILVPARTWLHHNIKRLVAHGKRPFSILVRSQDTTLRSTLDMCVVPTPLSEQGKGHVLVRAWPSSDLRTGWYRDSYDDLFAFLRASYPQFLVVNLVPRSQMAYGPGKTYGGRLANFPTPGSFLSLVILRNMCCNQLMKITNRRRWRSSSSSPTPCTPSSRRRCRRTVSRDWRMRSTRGRARPSSSTAKAGRAGPGHSLVRSTSSPTIVSRPFHRSKKRIRRPRRRSSTSRLPGSFLPPSPSSSPCRVCRRFSVSVGLLAWSKTNGGPWGFAHLHRDR